MAGLVVGGPSAALAGEPPRVDVVANEAQQRVDVLVDGHPFTAYIYPATLKKPVLYPLRAASGMLVTRGFPLEPRPGERVDHPHQVGVWLAHGDVNGVDFWNNSSARSAEEQAAMGTIRHRAVDLALGGVGEGHLGVTADWLLPNGNAVLRETTRFAFYVRGRDRIIERGTTLRAVGGPVVFTDSKEGLFGMRVTRALEQPSDEAVILTDASGRPGKAPRGDRTGVTGLYHSSEGQTGDDVWGTRARWVALSGTVDGEAITIGIFDHPRNPGHPAHWMARGYGLFAANPLGSRVFTEGREALDFALEPGAAATFVYRIAVLCEPFSRERLEALYQDFISGQR